MTPRTKRTVALLAIVCVAFALVWNFTHEDRSSWKIPIGTRAPILALGPDHGVVLASDGSLWSWGDNKFGWHSLGFGTNITMLASLRRIGTETNWVDVSVGGSTTVALKIDGSMWGWGESLYGQLGNTNTGREQPLPVRAFPGNDWMQVACAGPHTLALKRNGTIWSSGNNWAGQLGNGTTNSTRVPAQIGTSTNWTRVWANLVDNVAQQSDGSLWFWGWDYSRTAKGASISVPTRISPDTNWIDVGVGEWMAFAIKSDGTLWVWGRNAYLYANVDRTNDFVPLQVGHDKDWSKCADFGSPDPMFMKRDGSLWILNPGEERGVVDVTKTVQNLVTNDQLDMRVENSVLGSDPAFGSVKKLQVTYRYGDAAATINFGESTHVILGDAKKPLTITRALYGDPSLIEVFDPAPAKANVRTHAKLRRFPLEKRTVAFCGGRHALGVVITSDGELWHWGEVLGQSRTAFFPLPQLAKGLKLAHVNPPWDEEQPVILKEPTRLKVGQ